MDMQGADKKIYVNNFKEELKMLRKKVTAFVLTLAMLVSMIPMGVFAAPAEGYAVKLVGTRIGDFYTVDFQAKAPGNLATAQSLLLAFDTSIFKAVTFEDEAAVPTATPGASFEDVEGLGMPLKTWTETVGYAVSADGKYGYLRVEVSKKAGGAFPAFETLISVKLAITGNLEDNCIRLMTPEEYKKLSQGQQITLSDGTTSYNYGRENAEADTLAAPEFVFEGFEIVDVLPILPDGEEATVIDTKIVKKSVANGTAPDAFGLPEIVTVYVANDGGTVATHQTTLSVTWDLENIDYDPADKAEQIVNVSGTLTATEKVTNPNDKEAKAIVTVGKGFVPPPIEEVDYNQWDIDHNMDKFASYGGGGSITVFTWNSATAGYTNEDGLASGSITIEYKQYQNSIALNITNEVAKEIVEKVKSGTVTFDLSSISGVTEVIIPRTGLYPLGYGGLKVEFILPTGKIAFDAESAKSVAKFAQDNNLGANITLVLGEVSADSLKDALKQNISVGDLIYKVSINSDGSEIKGFSGNAAVSVPFGGEAPSSVWVINAKGNLSKAEASYDDAAGAIVIKG